MIHLAVITLGLKYLCEMPDVCYNIGLAVCDYNVDSTFCVFHVAMDILL